MSIVKFSIIALALWACGGGDVVSMDAMTEDAALDPRWDTLPDVGLGPI